MCKKNFFLFSFIVVFSILFIGASEPKPADQPRRLELLFLGHKSKHHDSEKLASIMTMEYFKSGLNISYTTDPDDLNENNLRQYDGLIVYANHDSITATQEKALLDFVKGGKGFMHFILL